MKTHIVYCHPSRTSFNARILDVVWQSIRKGTKETHTTKALLYEDGFDPVLSPDQYSHYASNEMIDDLSAAYARQLKTAGHLILVFPVWMYGAPAMLKGYFDKVWRPGVTFRLTDGILEPMLTELRRITVLCTFGQSGDVVLARTDPIQNLFIRMMEQNCTAACSLEYLPCYGCDTLGDTERNIYLEQVRRLIGSSEAPTARSSD